MQIFNITEFRMRAPQLLKTFRKEGGEPIGVKVRKRVVAVVLPLADYERLVGESPKQGTVATSPSSVCAATFFSNTVQ